MKRGWNSYVDAAKEANRLWRGALARLAMVRIQKVKVFGEQSFEDAWVLILH